MYVTQSIESPIGVTTFGSAVIRVEPDIASFKFSVTRLAQKPKEAFSEARDAANQVREYLAKTSIREIASSRLTLAQTFRWTNNENQFIGYTAKMAFHLIVDNLDQLESLTAGLVHAGVNQLEEVSFQTMKLKEIRAEARKRAVAAAREKAELYCQAAGVKLGSVRHIEDLNPDVLKSSGGHNQREPQPDDEETYRAVDPGSITIGAAVMIAFALDF